MSATFDEPNLVSCAGLVPVLRLAQRAGLHAVAQQRVRLPASAGSAAANAGAKITSVVAGMVAGADSIDDLTVIRHGALPVLFGGIRAPSTLGTFLREFTWGNVRQLDAVARETLTGLSRNAPLLPGADSSAFLDVDSYDQPRVRVCQSGSGLRLYPGTGIASLAGDGLDTDRRSGDRRYPAASGLGGLSQGRGRLRRRGHHHRPSGRGHRRAAGPDGLGVRQPRRGQRLFRAGVRFSITTKQTRPVRAAIEAIEAHAWVPIAYPQAIYDQDSGQWISDAQIAETSYTAYRSRRKSAI